MSIKITRTLYNNYTKKFEVYFEDGVVIEGDYSVNLSHSSSRQSEDDLNIEILIRADYNKNKDLKLKDVYICEADSDLRAKIRERIKEIISKNF